MVSAWYNWAAMCGGYRGGVGSNAPLHCHMHQQHHAIGGDGVCGIDSSQAHLEVCLDAVIAQSMLIEPKEVHEPRHRHWSSIDRFVFDDEPNWCTAVPQISYI